MLETPTGLPNVTQEDLARCRQEALDFANSLRVENKLKPLKKMPKAREWDARTPWNCSCPLAVALEELEPTVHPTYVRLFSNGQYDVERIKELPQDVYWFVKFVDTHLYPDLHRGFGNA